ncbi:MAG: type IV pilus modification protein PilV [Halioglobus sp.]|nr:type IV pilus modification protein PilV [Halioglobus sp.]
MSCRLRLHDQGIAMLELMIALLIFSVGVMGFARAQLLGKQAAYDALQRSIATVLAGDVLERMRANASHVRLDSVHALGGAAGWLPRPAADCETSSCVGAQWAVYDLWHWQQQLRGGTLLYPQACIVTTAGTVRVEISWRAMSRAVDEGSSPCAEDGGRRHRLTLFSFLGSA